VSSDEERGGIPENLTKKILTLGLGAYFLTEDTVRRYVKDAKIPRDIARSITQNASKGKDELYGYVARELSSFLKQMDLQQELDRFVRSHKVRISAEIEFLPKPSATSLHEDAPLEDETDDDPSDPSGSSGSREESSSMVRPKNPLRRSRRTRTEAARGALAAGLLHCRAAGRSSAAPRAAGRRLDLPPGLQRHGAGGDGRVAADRPA